MRQRFMFWLDLEKPQEEQISNDIQRLKKSGLFARTLRDGIRLIQDLRAGRVEVLQELFPWVLEQQVETLAAIQALPAPESEADDRFTAQLKRLEKLLLTQGAVPIADGQRISSSPIPLNRKSGKETKNSLDSIELEISRAKQSADNNSAWNFMISSAALQGKFEGLPQNVIDYGLATGRIPPHAVKQKSKPAANPKAMDVPQFDVPAFDDIDFSLDSS